MRVFVAVELSAQARDHLSQFAQSVAIADPGASAPPRRGPLRLPVRWTRPENYHLTLRFLGEVDEEVANGLGSALQTALAGGSPFSLRLGGVGCFPPRGAPRVLWVGVESGLDELVALGASVDLALAASGLPAQNSALSPHVTLGRVNAERGPATLEIARRFLAAEYPASGASVPESLVSGVSLIESRLASSGPRYFNLARVGFDARR